MGGGGGSLSLGQSQPLVTVDGLNIGCVLHVPFRFSHKTVDSYK